MSSSGRAPAATPRIEPTATPRIEPAAPPRIEIGLASLALIALVLAAFWSAFDARFLHWDDKYVITDNREFRGLDGEHVRWMLSTGHMGHYQPLTWLSYALDHRFHGLQPPEFREVVGFRATNYALHALTAIALLLVARELVALGLRRGRNERAVLLAALAAAAAFAAHPLRVESVVWITERRDVLSGVFFVLAVRAWIAFGRDRGPPSFDRRRAIAIAALSAAAVGLFLASVRLRHPALSLRGLGAFGLAASALALVGSGWLAAGSRDRRAAFLWMLACALLSLLSKAWGIVLPALLVVLDVWPLRRATSARDVGRLALEKAPLFALSIVFATLAQWAQSSWSITQPSLARHTVLERIGQAAYGLVFYPWKTLWPSGLSPLYEMPDRIELASVRFGGALAAAVAITWAAWSLRRRAPALLAAWAAFVVIVSPVLGLAQSGPQLVADRYSYLACMPFAVLVGGGALAWLARHPRWTTLALALGGATVVALAVATSRQARRWLDNESLWTYARALDPTGPEICTSLAFARLESAQRSADPAEQYRLYLSAAELMAEAARSKEDPRILSNASLVHGALARFEPARRDQHVASAVALAGKAVEVAARLAMPLADYRSNYGANLNAVGRSTEALEQFEAVVQERPTWGQGWFNVGLAYSSLGRLPEARDAFRNATRLLPRHADSWLNLAVLEDHLGERERAKAALARVLELQPSHPAALELQAKWR